ncbi:MAG TPA: hypothetical protein DHV36_17065 [Desulfobacteraceae bacterium]|nr:hypothetical protein [Desulfobacteraceae bacterium]
MPVRGKFFLGRYGVPTCIEDVLNVSQAQFLMPPSYFLGFGDTADDLMSSFTSYERMTNDTELWGKITAVNPVPEPTTMLLFGFGLLGVANIARKKLG